jgi:hypothetical protein
MKKHSAAPSGGSEGGGFDTENIGSGRDDLKSLAQLPVTELLRRAAARELTWRTGHCAGCNQKYQNTLQPVATGIWVWPLLNGVVLYTLCWECVPLIRDPLIRARIRDEAYRSLFKAGPDDVAGTA